MNANLKNKVRAAAAPAAALALVLSGTAYGVSQAVAASSAELAVTATGHLGGYGADTSDLALTIELDSHPDHSMCSDTIHNTGRLPAGCPLIAILTVTNNGTSPATHVVLSAPQPIGWVNPIIEQPTSGCSLDENEDLLCDLGTIPVGGTAQVKVAGMTDASEDAYVMASVARVSADGIEQTPEDNIATDILILQPEADLSIVLVPQKGDIVPGAPATWTAVATNNGPSVASGVRILQSVTDAFDANFVDVTVTTSDGSPVTCKDLLQNANTARCRADALAPGATMTMTVVGTLASDLSDTDALIYTTAGVSSHTIDPDSSNNVTKAAVSLAPAQASLLIGIDGPEEVQIGERGAWEFTIENAGPSNANGTRILLDIPEELTDVAVTSNHGPCTQESCDLGTLLSSDDPKMPGNTVTVTVTGYPAFDATYFELSGHVVSSTNTGVGVTEASTTVTVDQYPFVSDEPLADMAVSNFTITPLDPDFTGPGSEHRIRFTVTNNGPDAAKYPAFRLGRSTDAEANLGHKSVEQNPKDTAWQNLCQTTSRELMCVLNSDGVLAAGQSVVVDYTITLASSGRAGEFPDYIYAYSTTEDPNQLNDTAQANIVVGEPATELYLTIEPTGTVANYGSPGTPGSMDNPDGHPSFVAGGMFQYDVDIRVPEGRYSDAANVMVTLNPPAGFLVNYATSADGQCVIADRVTCLLPTVSAGSISTINIGGIVSDQANDLHHGDSWAEQVPFQVTATTDTPTRGGKAILRSATAYVDIIESADLWAYITPDEAGTTDPGVIGFTVTVLNTGLSGVEHAAVTAVIPDGWQLNAAASNCVAPPRNEIDIVGDGVANLLPLADGFKLDDPKSIACQVGELPGGDRTGIVDAGKSGSIRVILEKTPGATYHSEGEITFVAGSLAFDPDHSNNTVSGSLAPLSLAAHAGNILSGITGAQLPVLQRFLFPTAS